MLLHSVYHLGGGIHPAMYEEKKDTIKISTHKLSIWYVKLNSIDESNNITSSSFSGCSETVMALDYWSSGHEMSEITIFVETG